MSCRVPQLKARANDSLGLPFKCLDVCLPPYWTAFLASHSLSAHKNGASLGPRRRKRSSSSVTSSPFPRPCHEDMQPYRFKYKEHRNTSVYNKRRARRYQCCPSTYVYPLPGLSNQLILYRKRLLGIRRTSSGDIYRNYRNRRFQ
jgi:hypothetical protein